MPKWRKNWENSLPDEGRSPESGYRMAAEGVPFPWRWTSGTISTQLDVIWGMSVQGQNVGLHEIDIADSKLPRFSNGVG